MELIIAIISIVAITASNPEPEDLKTICPKVNSGEITMEHAAYSIHERITKPMGHVYTVENFCDWFSEPLVASKRGQNVVHGSTKYKTLR